MAAFDASVRPSPPISSMYAHAIVRIDADPYGVAETGPTGARSLVRCGCDGRYGAKWALTPIGPMPGPPPPWGMQKVLCRLKWLTSAPYEPGRARPTWALRLAPSR